MNFYEFTWDIFSFPNIFTKITKFSCFSMLDVFSIFLTIIGVFDLVTLHSKTR